MGRLDFIVTRSIWRGGVSSREPRSIRAAARGLAASCVLAAALAPSTATADDSSPYCRAVEARAAGDASLLMTPRAIVEGIHVPLNGTLTGTGGVPTVGASQNELRAGGGWSPTDFYKGLATLSLASVDCRRHAVEAAADQVLLQARDVGRLPALRKQTAFLEQHRAEWQEITKKEQERFIARVISVVDLNTVVLRAVALERLRVQARSEADRLEARAFSRPPAPLGVMEQNLLASESDYEKKASHIRTLAAWQILVTGGVVPTDQPVDAYGLVELSFNLGAFLAYSKEGTYLSARAEELKSAKYERAWRLRSLQKEVDSARSEALDELEIVEGQLELLSATRRALESSETPAVLHAIAALRIEEITAGADRAYLRSLADELAAFLTVTVVEKAHGS